METAVGGTKPPWAVQSRRRQCKTAVGGAKPQGTVQNRRGRQETAPDAELSGLSFDKERPLYGPDHMLGSAAKDDL